MRKITLAPLGLLLLVAGCASTQTCVAPDGYDGAACEYQWDGSEGRGSGSTGS